MDGPDFDGTMDDVPEPLRDGVQDLHTQIRNGECPERHPNNIAALQALASPYRFPVN